MQRSRAMTTISQSVVTFLLNALWEVTLVCGVAQIGSWAMRAAPARFRYRGWLAAAILAVVLPLGSIFAPLRALSLLSAPLATVDQSNFWIKTRGSAFASSFSLSSAWMYPLVLSYLAFLGYRLLQFVWAWRRTKQLRHSAYLPEFPSPVLSIMERCRSSFGIRTVSIRCSPLVRGPLTVGIWSPQILLPADVLTTASHDTASHDDEWTSMLSHELAHICRKDFVKNLACELLCLPVSFHPLMAVIKAHLAAAREMACDELATGRCIAPERYVHALLSMAKKMCYQPSPAALDYSVGIFDGNILEERIMKLLHRNSLSVFWSRASLALVLAALTALSISASAFAVRIGEEKTATSSAAGTPTGDDSKIARVGPGITPPRAISTPDPEYTRAARDANVEGTVQLWCVIGLMAR